MSPMQEHYVHLAAQGPGWHPYCLDAAQRLEREDEVHRGIVAAVERVIAADLPAAKEALKWFRSPKGA